MATADKPLRHDYFGCQCGADYCVVASAVPITGGHVPVCGQKKAAHEPPRRPFCEREGCPYPYRFDSSDMLLRGKRYHMECAAWAVEKLLIQAERELREIDEASGRAWMGTAPSLLDHIKALVGRAEWMEGLTTTIKAEARRAGYEACRDDALGEAEAAIDAPDVHGPWGMRNYIIGRIRALVAR